MPESRETLEKQLNDFEPGTRRAALEALLEKAEAGTIQLPAQTPCFNMHCHSFFSYNGYGYSPTGLAWQGRAHGLMAMGLVDFDVLDGVDEFLAASSAVGLRACAGLETRVFVPEFADRVINSPGEPGISYHMGAGFTSSAVRDDALLREMKGIAGNRTRGMVDRINPHLGEAQLDFEKDVLPLTPTRNATERHVCMAYEEKAKSVFPDAASRTVFWAERLGVASAEVEAVLDDPPLLQGLIRSKTMKAGGVGYAKPEGPDFPRLADVNAFILDNGAVPTFAFLDGASAGEAAIEELLEVMMASGVAAVNIIPDRNWNIKDPETKKVKVAKLYDFVEQAQARDLPILVGTEMNAYGQRFVDDFGAPELELLRPAFLEGVYVFHAHTLLQGQAGMGYLSDWAKQTFSSTAEKNRFYAKVGEMVAAPGQAFIDRLTPTATPEEIIG